MLEEYLAGEEGTVTCYAAFVGSSGVLGHADCV